MSGEGTETALDVAPASLSFGQVRLGESARQSVTFSNNGTEPIDITSLSVVGGNGAFTKVSGSATLLEAGESLLVAVEFRPIQAGDYSGSLHLEAANDEVPAISVSLSGTGTAPDIEVDPESIVFENATVSSTTTRSITIRNRGSLPLEVESTSIEGPDADDFRIISGSGLLMLAPGSTAIIEVQLDRVTEEPYSGTLVIVSNDPDEPMTSVHLSSPSTIIEES